MIKENGKVGEGITRIIEKNEKEDQGLLKERKWKNKDNGKKGERRTRILERAEKVEKGEQG